MKIMRSMVRNKIEAEIQKKGKILQGVSLSGQKPQRSLLSLLDKLKGKKIKGVKKLGKERAKKLFKGAKGLLYWLSRNWEERKHSLKLREEDIIAHKDVNAISPLLDVLQLIEKDIQYEMKIGKQKKVIETRGELMSYVYSDKSEEREAAYKSLLTEHEKQSDKSFAIYQGLVKDWGYEAKLRKYSSAIGMRNKANRIPDEAVEQLLETCREERGVFERYFKYKAEKLGVKKLRRYDIYAPLKMSDKKIGYEKTKEMVMEMYREVDSEFFEGARKIFENGHVDSHPRKNKRSGAFCSTITTEIAPYVMLNFDGQLRDVSTMAHELGHGIHSILANKQRYWTQRSPLPLAETASTFSELLMFDRLLEMENSKEVKESMLSAKVADAYATILRQNYFVIFELKAHEALNRGVTKEELSEIYFETLKEQFGKVVDIDKSFRYEWAYVTHFFESPFYCYAYNFGELVSYNLYRRYKENNRFIKEIKKLLSMGGSEDPVVKLKEIGIDIKSKDFWKDSMSQVIDWQDRLERI
jgi:oligoendopeptidase F